MGGNSRTASVAWSQDHPLNSIFYNDDFSCKSTPVLHVFLFRTAKSVSHCTYEYRQFALPPFLFFGHHIAASSRFSRVFPHRHHSADPGDLDDLFDFFLIAAACGNRVIVKTTLRLPTVPDTKIKYYYYAVITIEHSLPTSHEFVVVGLRSHVYVIVRIIRNWTAFNEINGFTADSWNSFQLSRSRTQISRNFIRNASYIVNVDSYDSTMSGKNCG